MNLLERLKNWFKPKQPEKKGFWTPYHGNIGNTYDSFGGQPEPSQADLVKAYDDIVYACVSLIAQNIAHIPIRLYVRTETGQREPKCFTRPVNEKNARRIYQKYYGTDVKEVVEHPLMELLAKCNAFHNKRDLLELTETYLDLTGNSFWLMRFNGLGIPDEIYLLPSHLVQPERDEDYFVTSWLFGQGMLQKRYSLNEVIHFKYANPADPYGIGVSPLRGAWSRHQISGKELSYIDNFLSNQGRFDSVLSIKNGVNPMEAERLAKELRHRAQGPANGGTLVLEGTMNLQPLSWPVQNYAELEMYQVLKTVMCNCFHIPPDVFELGTSSNRSTREAALYALASQCLAPRITGIVQKLNDQLVPFFDKRFFFEADSPVQEDKDFELQKIQLLLAQQVITRDEARVREGFASADWAKEPLLPSGVMPLNAFDEDIPQEQVEQPQEQPPDRTAQASQVQALQQAVFGKLIPREAGLAQLQIIYGFTPQEAEALVPELPETTPQNAQNDPGQAQTGEAGQTPPEAGQAPQEGKSYGLTMLELTGLAEALDNGQEVIASLPGRAVVVKGISDTAVATDEDELPLDQFSQTWKGLAITSKSGRGLKQASPAPLVKTLSSFFKSLAKSVLAQVEQHHKSVSVVDWFDMEAWTQSMFNDTRPVLAAFYDHAAKETIANLNLTSSLFNTVQPKLREGVSQSCMVLCQETLATTKLELNTAITTLRKEISEGLEVGDVKNAMMERVQKVFTEAETDRAFRIGVTEASRGQHNAMIMTAKESGVVAGKTWLLSDDACPICLPLSGKTVGLDENFDTDGSGPYAEIGSPPRHPYCRCAMTLKTT